MKGHALTPRSIHHRRCPRCRRITPHEPVVRFARDPKSYLFLGLYDYGAHCYSCGYDHGFALPRSWSTLEVRPAIV